jgi:putative heme-binding domain-containing protein
MFVGNVVNSRINHDRLEWNGSSPRAIEQPDFLVSEDPWFRPVDLEIGPDGALYVADFYNRIIGHYEVDINHPGRDRTRGRIWRIVYTGSEPSTPARQVNRDWWNVRTSDLVRALGSPNLALRMIAANVMVDRGGEEVIKGALDAWRGGSPDARVHALWILERLHALDESLWALSAQNDEASLRVHAMRVASGRERWSLGMHEAVSLGLADLNPHVQRAAAEAIAAHPSRDWIRPLLATLAHADAADDHLAHTLRIAIRDQLARAPSSWQLLAWSPWTDADRARLAAIATGVHSKEAARFLLDSLDTARGSGPIPDEQAHHIARWGDDALLASLVKTARPKLEPAASLGMIRELVRGARERGGRLEASTRAWALATASALLDAKDLGQQVSAIELAESAQLSELSPNVAAVLRDRAAREHARQAAARTILAIDPNTAASALAEILAAGDEPVAVREHAASWLGRLVASHPEARRDMAQALTLAEGRLQNHIAAQLAGSVEGARLLLETIESGKASARLLQERAVSLPLGQKAQSIDRLAERIGALTAGLEPPEAKVQSLIDQRRDEFTHRPGDAARGASVFKTNCAPCHQINGEGSKIGPQLDGVGSRGLARLLEDVLDPNRNVDQAFRSTTLALENGQVFSGLLLREEGDVLVLADNEGKEQRHGKGDIEERKVTNLSPMPAAMADKLAPADLADLMAYLLRQTTKPAAAAGAP